MKLLALAIGLAVMLAAVACSDSQEALDDATASATSQRTEAAGTPAPPFAATCTIDEPGCGPGLDTGSPPPLTADQERAKQIALADPVVISVLGAASYQVTGVAGFSVRDSVVIGSVITIALDQPLLVDADLPYIDMGYRGEEGNGTPIDLPPPYYIDGVSHTTQFDTKSLFIDVDLNRGKVVSIIAAPF